MQLTYRAVRYEVNPTDVKATASYSTGIYRGVKINIPTPVAKPQTYSPRQLKYRGVIYII
ncbi:DUF4278 domain-containing protein [Aliinostoc sp. HNIBRCY26]|uniref:DUF4278 domain-containing protein n=1 Tax=Aliinostoc sp. HNIBRCY26 TaxID=3418997 RepID=UPI003D00BBE1